MESGSFFSDHIFRLVIIPVLIFLARIMDVSIGTMRVIFVSRGFKFYAALCGFFEVLIWIIAITQIIKNLNNPLYYIAYAGGFATGNFIGMVLEEKIALGTVLLRIVVPHEIEELEKYLKEITDIKEVSCCYMLREVSEWRIYLSVWTKTIERYDEIQTKIITKFKKHIKNYISFQSVKSYTYFGRVLNTKKKAQCDIKGNPENFELKEMEWKIIDILRKDSRIPVVKLARELKTTTNTIIKKLKYLVDNNVIERCYPTIDMKKAGYKGYIYITRLDPSYSKQIEEFIEYAKSDPRFDFFIKAVGYVNLYYSFLVKDEAEFVEIVSKVDKIIGDATLKTYKIEVEGIMIS